MLEVFFCLIVGVSSSNALVVDCEKDGPYEEYAVRLMAAGIPEKGGAMGSFAHEVLSELTVGQIARLECVPAQHSNMSEPRICTVWVAPQSAQGGAPTLDVGLAMITIGAAWWNQGDLAYQTLQQRGQYEFAQMEAKAKGAGGWQTSSEGFSRGKNK